MQSKDIVIVNVTGTNGGRHTKTLTRRFNGEGLPLNDDGQVTESAERLRNLPNGETKLAPSFPADKFAAAQAKGAAGATEVKEILMAHAKQVDEWQKTLGGGDERVQIARSVLEFAKEFHNFREKDEGDYFVMKAENLSVNSAKLGDGRTLYTVTGTAVFGAVAA